MILLIRHGEAEHHVKALTGDVYKRQGSGQAGK